MRQDYKFASYAYRVYLLYELKTLPDSKLLRLTKNRHKLEIIPTRKHRTQLTVSALLTAICLPFKNAPCPKRAVYISFIMGLYTIPICNSFFRTNATEMAVNGMP